MHIRQIDLRRPGDVNQFIRFPFQLYAGSEQWVPPLLSDARSSLNPDKHPFYRHSEAAFFLAEDGGKTLARLAVMENSNHNRYRGEQIAFFGFFDCIDDRQVSTRIFEIAFDWARLRGLERIIGPRGLIGTDGSGVLVEGFEHRPALSVPYNYPYYDALLKASGFEKDTDHLSGYLPGDHPLPDRLQKIAELVKTRRGYAIKHFSSKAEMRRWVPRVTAVHAQAFANTHTYYPPTQEEFDSIVNTILSVADPRLIKLVLKDGQVIGFIFAYHDISAALQRSGGRLWPLGWLYLLMERNRTKWVNVNGVGLLPAYQGLGGNAILYAEIQKSVRRFNFEHIDVVLVNETNFTSKRDMEAIGVRWYKRHRSYKRSLALTPRREPYQE